MEARIFFDSYLPEALRLALDYASAFSVGQRVLTSSHGNVGHTRLPQYARGRYGLVHAYHGAHVFPDLSAQGQEIHQHLYSISFTATELWPEVKNSKDKVYLDLWESYLLDGQS